jgi:hypothetical protein
VPGLDVVEGLSHRDNLMTLLSDKIIRFFVRSRTPSRPSLPIGGGVVAGSTFNQKLIDWVAEWADLLDPARMHRRLTD